MSDILFSHSYYYRLDPKQWKNHTPFPPLGTLYAASLLRENGYQVDLFDTNLLDNPRAITGKLENDKPRYLVIYDDGFNYLTKMCLTIMREACFEMITIGKQHQCTVIVCSSDSTDHYQKYLDKGADYILQGEGEASLLELINTLEHKTSVTTISGIIYTDPNTNQIRINPKRPILQNLDELPLPAWDLIDIDSYKAQWQKSGQPFTLNIATTRGCPYKCNWCAKPIYGNRYNAHSPDYIVRQIAHLKSAFGVTRFWMCDDIFGLKPNWVQEFGKLLDEQQLSIRYYIQSRADLLLKEDTITVLARTGLEEVWIGAESGSQKILDAMDKGTTVAQIYEATRLLKKNNVRISFFLQFGYLTENQDDIQKTIAMVKELLPDNIGISVSYPLPGTKFYDKVKEDLKQKSNWTDSDDLDMMFHGTYTSEYYRKLQRLVHKEYRISQGIYFLKNLFRDPVRTDKLKSIAKLSYYIPSAGIDRYQIKALEKP
ncbi:B12-binding domain-containing radical SAM protein [Flavobacterium supellecticarium]|uniref:B12-binding domain-containing radical SAM protein n=1 Tax=Flavobacterium supellecticarium TaxID=2565924 RepID=A0A4V3W7V5_9FLAO|nr:radical SAM protein [Flavobacterium supellecticarium]THF48825.1 B12-binding domain-containing radical SAM protein [Flavobacterium supellecticarium]